MNENTCKRLNRDIQDNLGYISEVQEEILSLQKQVFEYQSKNDRKNKAIQLSLVASPDSITCIDEHLVDGLVRKEYILRDCEFSGFISTRYYCAQSGILLWYCGDKKPPKFCLHMTPRRLDSQDIIDVCPNWQSLEHLKIGESYGIS